MGCDCMTRQWCFSVQIPAAVDNVMVFSFEDFLKRGDQKKLVPLDKYK